MNSNVLDSNAEDRLTHDGFPSYGIMDVQPKKLLASVVMSLSTYRKNNKD